MEKRDVELVEKYGKTDADLARLYKEHVSLDRELKKMDRKPFLTPEEDAERHRLQKMKLLGRDRIEKILRKYRNG